MEKIWKMQYDRNDRNGTCKKMMTNGEQW
jgi:hypothetical protein